MAARSRRANVKTELPQEPMHGHFAESRALRTRMRAEDGLENGPMVSETTSQGRPPRTPGEERQLRGLMELDDSKDEEDNARPSTRHPRSSPRSNEREVTSQPQRRLRSSRTRTRSPTPAPERWTDKNPTWQDDHNWNIPLIYERTTINATDVVRLDEGQFLNDEIISFYAKYLHKQLEEGDERMAKRVYICNPFFYEQLKTRSYDGVKSWTAKIDLFSFDHIIVPINQNAHWYLAIICNPGGLLPREDTAPDTQETPAVEEKSNARVHMDVKADATAATVTSDIKHMSTVGQVEGSMASDGEETKKAPSGRKSKASRKGPGPRKYDPKDPRVITLDSLDGSHPSVSNALKNYLTAEIKNKKGIDVEISSPFGMTAKDIPFQNNFTDCGVYLLGYLEEFMKDPCEFTRRILQQEPRDWNVNAPTLRNKIRDLIFELQKSYQAEEMRKRRQKKNLAIQRQRKSQTPAGEAQSSPRVTNEQPHQRPPASASPAPNPRSATAADSSTRTLSEQASGPEKQQCRSEKPPLLSSASASPAVESRRQTPSRIRSSPVRRTHADAEPFQRPVQSPNWPPPLQRDRTGSGQSQGGGSDAPNLNASMIVHPNDSVEIKDQQIQSPLTPRVVHVMISVEDANGTAEHVQHSAKSLTTREAPRKSESSPSTAAKYDETKFLQPIASSPPTSAAPPGSPGQNEPQSSRALARKDSSRNEETQSPYFTLAEFKRPNPGVLARQEDIPDVTTVPSFPEEKRKKKPRKENTYGKKDRQGDRKSGTIVDLTKD